MRFLKDGGEKRCHNSDSREDQGDLGLALTEGHRSSGRAALGALGDLEAQLGLLGRVVLGVPLVLAVRVHPLFGRFLRCH